MAKKLALAISLAFVVVACGASPSTERASLSTSEPISCESAGIHVDGTCVGTSPPTRTCAVDTVCLAQPTTLTPPMYFDGDEDAGICSADTTFSDELAAMGCSQPFFYTANRWDPDHLFETFRAAWCPHAPADPNPIWTTFEACNTCTGAPPVGTWVLVGWADASSYCGGHGPQPGGGCTQKTCLSL